MEWEKLFANHISDIPGGSWLKFLIMTLLLLLVLLITGCVFYKVTVNCLSRCASPTPARIMTFKQGSDTTPVGPKALLALEAREFHSSK